jgi:energy-coupling factor transporter ATP-binding protein EcfA2
MRFQEVLVENFRGITRAHLTNLSDTVVIAGPNGCGKSSIFDALRLWKSAYAGYQNEELQWWLQEFGLAGGHNAFVRVLQSPSRPMVISATITLLESEKAWLRTNAVGLTREAAFRRLVPNYGQVAHHPMHLGIPRAPHLAEALRAQEPAVQELVRTEVPVFLTQLEQPSLTGQLVCYPDGRAETINSVALARIFSLYDGRNVGIIDYHGPQRTFAREEVGGISLQIEQYQAQRQQSALYNYTNKYGSVKQELASAYVRDLVAKSAGGSSDSAGLGLAKTLEELFSRFFPGKRFRGVEPNDDGSVKFEVETLAGNHDINELSSGEKELLYGYLRLRNYAPHNSIILLDEPELHLNPRLTDGLTDFYHRHVGVALGNQLWLVTHSDTILRQSIGRDGYRVFHMLSAGNSLADPNQILEINASDDLDRAVIDLVGDLAAYKPGAKLVFIEGGGPVPFDENLINELFPAFAASVNLITSGNKAKVRQIGSLLDRAREAGAVIAPVFAISDNDNDDKLEALPANCYRWDRYHIENYLLEPDYIAKVVIDLGLARGVDVRPEPLMNLLRDRAAETLPDLLRHEIENGTNRQLVAALSTRVPRNERFDVSLLTAALERTSARVAELLNGPLAEGELKVREQEVRARLEADLASGRWIQTFRGRDVLKRFLTTNLAGLVRYEVFRDLIVARMRDARYKPEGMAVVLDQIEAAA